MKIALAQINTRIGDFAVNRRRIVAAVEEARRQGADLAVLPEMGDGIPAPGPQRWQHGIVLKVSEKAFGTGRMMPVTRSA